MNAIEVKNVIDLRKDDRISGVFNGGRFSGKIVHIEQNRSDLWFVYIQPKRTVFAGSKVVGYPGKNFIMHCGRTSAGYFYRQDDRFSDCLVSKKVR